MTSDALRRYALAIAAHAALIALWFLIVTYGRVPSFIMPSPSALPPPKL